MIRHGLRRRRSALLADDFDDPLLGMVNLFDIAMVFAVALVVALVFATDSQRALSGREPATPLPDPSSAASAPSSRGEEVGRVLRLPSGELVYTIRDGSDD